MTKDNHMHTKMHDTDSGTNQALFSWFDFEEVVYDDNDQIIAQMLTPYNNTAETRFYEVMTTLELLR